MLSLPVAFQKQLVAAKRKEKTERQEPGIRNSEQRIQRQELRDKNEELGHNVP